MLIYTKQLGLFKNYFINLIKIYSMKLNAILFWFLNFSISYYPCIILYKDIKLFFNENLQILAQYHQKFNMQIKLIVHNIEFKYKILSWKLEILI